MAARSEILRRALKILAIFVLTGAAHAGDVFPLPAIPGNRGIIDLVGDSSRLRALDRGGRIWELDGPTGTWLLRGGVPALISLAGAGNLLYGLGSDGRVWSLRGDRAVAVRVPQAVRLIRTDRKGLLFMVAADGSIWQSADGPVVRIGQPSPVRDLRADGEVVALLEDGRLFRWAGDDDWRFIGGRPSTRQLVVDLGIVLTLEEDGTIWRFIDGNWQTVRVRSTATGIAARDGVLYTVGRLGIHRIADGAWRLIAAPTLPPGRLVPLDRGTVLWAGNGGELLRIDPETPALQAAELSRISWFSSVRTVQHTVEAEWIGNSTFPVFRRTVR